MSKLTKPYQAELYTDDNQALLDGAPYKYQALLGRALHQYWVLLGGAPH